MEDMMIKVLDHGYIRLFESMGSDLSIVRNARNSHDAAWRTGQNEKSDARLIEYLWKNFHTTPFEAVTMTFEVKLPLFVARQWMRHRTWTYNEVSARYSQLPNEFYVPAQESVGTQSVQNKQGRINTALMEPSVEYARRNQIEWYKKHCAEAYEKYDRAVRMEREGWGWPRELARCFLPVSIYTKFFGTVNLLNLFRFLTLRMDEHAQMEIRVYANAAHSLISGLTPVAMAAFDKYKIKMEADLNPEID